MNDFLTLNRNKRLHTDGLLLLSQLKDAGISCAFFDPQYREVMDAMKYGNEGKSRQSKRAALPQMPTKTILDFLTGIALSLKPGGHVFWWLDKFTIGEGLHVDMLRQVNTGLPKANRLHAVDLLIWDKGRIGNGARLRRRFEPCFILQRTPKSVKNWKSRSIPDVWEESIVNPRKGHPHKKPPLLLLELIGAVTDCGDYVLDPCAGSFEVLFNAMLLDRYFIGGDISSEYGKESMRCIK
jgi:site-specific DNA-methyltransferase (adenine-specific)